MFMAESFVIEWPLDFGIILSKPILVSSRSEATSAVVSCRVSLTSCNFFTGSSVLGQVFLVNLFWSLEFYFGANLHRRPFTIRHR